MLDHLSRGTSELNAYIVLSLSCKTEFTKLKALKYLPTQFDAFLSQIGPDTSRDLTFLCNVSTLVTRRIRLAQFPKYTFTKAARSFKRANAKLRFSQLL